MISQAPSSAPGGAATRMPMLTLPGLSVTTQSYNSDTVVDLHNIFCSLGHYVSIWTIKFEISL